jgi:hypothetical protein
MLIGKLRHALPAIFIGALLFAAGQPASAQNQSQAAGKTAAKKGKATAESCAGALDLVPAKAMTFIRKRRPSKAQSGERERSGRSA